MIFEVSRREDQKYVLIFPIAQYCSIQKIFMVKIIITTLILLSQDKLCFFIF